MSEEYRVSLAAARVNARLTQREVAEKMHVNVGTVVNWENGRSAIDADKFVALCELYECPIDVISLPTMST